DRSAGDNIGMDAGFLQGAQHPDVRPATRRTASKCQADLAIVHSSPRAVLATARASAFSPPVDHSGQALSERYDGRVKSCLPRVPTADIAGWLRGGTAQRQKKLKRAAKRRHRRRQAG